MRFNLARSTVVALAVFHLALIPAGAECPFQWALVNGVHSPQILSEGLAKGRGTLSEMLGTKALSSEAKREIVERLINQPESERVLREGIQGASDPALRGAIAAALIGPSKMAAQSKTVRLFEGKGTTKATLSEAMTFGNGDDARYATALLLQAPVELKIEWLGEHLPTPGLNYDTRIQLIEAFQGLPDPRIDGILKSTLGAFGTTEQRDPAKGTDMKVFLTEAITDAVAFRKKAFTP